MNESVASILISTEDEFILQQREDRPDISSPGMVTVFGGGVEEGEEPMDAIIREMEEELTIKLNKEDFRFLESYVKKDPLNDQECLAHLYIAQDINKGDLFLKEGEAIVYLKPDESFDDLSISKETKEILHKFKETSMHQSVK